MKYFNDIGDNRDENYGRLVRKYVFCSVNNEDLFEGSINFFFRVVVVYCSLLVYFFCFV